tara:strand:- start:4430 stop:5680 length:1251 start_codon:yes stop_codon:yes gene_type:complete
MQNNYLFNHEYLNSKIFFDKGKGSYIYFKNKKFIDLGYCAGSLLLGHNSNTFSKSLKLIAKKNISNLAYTNIYALEFSKTLKKILHNYSKFILCNSGTEAVFKALRICKGVTNKKKIVSVVGSWHGSVDNTLYFPGKNLEPKKISDGLSDSSKENIIFIPYNDIFASKKILDKNKKKIQCIIIEPIQGCLPLENSKKYLKFLENYCKKNNLILFFDEMITGLRTNCNSVQQIYKIKPDVSTFGKCFGGGVPIGIIGISKKIESKIKKKKLKIFFGGTFSAGSINSFIANENLKYILKNKKKIFKKINNLATDFQKNINKFCIKNSLDVQVVKFQSMAQIIFSRKKIYNRIQKDYWEKEKKRKIANFKKYLFNNGINYPTSGNIFFAYSLSKKNLKYVTDKINYGLKKFFNTKKVLF